MSSDQHMQNELDHDYDWLNDDGPHINCPDCGDYLWNGDAQDFDRHCPHCGWCDPRIASELPETIQGALGFMQLVIQKVESGLPLTPDERQLLAQAGVYAVIPD